VTLVADTAEHTHGARLDRIIVLAMIAAGIIALDQVTKAVAFHSLNPYESRLVLGGIVEFHEQRNPGAAFGILRNVPGSAIILTATTVATLVLLAYLFRRYIRSHFATGTLAAGLIYGGAIGNGIDRVVFGRVRDFIALHLRIFDWPAFNVADIMIVTGIAMLLVGLMLLPADTHRGRHGVEAAQPAEPETDHPPSEAAPGSRKEA
jgi:signal peptidase II